MAYLRQERNFTHFSGGGGKEPHRTGCRWEDNIKMNPAGISNDVDQIQLVQDKMQALVNTCQVLYKEGNLTRHMTSLPEEAFCSKGFRKCSSDQLRNSQNNRVTLMTRPTTL
jgi:hypothetical protein